MKKSFWPAVFLTLMIGVCPVWAQEDEAAEGAEAVEAGAGLVEEEHIDWSGLLLRWVNFTILFGGLGYLLRQPAADFFKTRLGAIQSGLEGAREARAGAEEKMVEIESRLSRLSSELEEIRSDAEKSAEGERERIVADAKGEVTRALKQSQAEVDLLARRMGQEIRAEVADRVIERTEEQLRSRLSEADRERIVKRAVEEL